MAMTESVLEFVFGKSLGLSMSDNGRVYDGFCSEVLRGLRLCRNLFLVKLQVFSSVTEFPVEFVLSKASGLYCK